VNDTMSMYQQRGDAHALALGRIVIFRRVALVLDTTIVTSVNREEKAGELGTSIRNPKSLSVEILAVRIVHNNIMYSYSLPALYGLCLLLSLSPSAAAVWWWWWC
jgi:hypothetical protein